MRGIIYFGLCNPFFWIAYPLFWKKRVEGCFVFGSHKAQVDYITNKANIIKQ